MSSAQPSATYTTAKNYAQTTTKIALAALTPTTATTLYHTLSEQLETLCQNSPDHGHHACTSGCGWCCHQPVYITRIEAIALVNYLRQHWPAQWLNQLPTLLQQRLQKRQALGNNMAVIKYGLACAFLSEDNNCTVHEARPLACRGHLSSSAKACEDFFVDLTNAPPPIDSVAHDAAKGMLHGVRAAMDLQPLEELNAAVLALIAPT